MTTSAKTLLYACLLGIAMSCSSSSSSSSNKAEETIDSIPVHQIDNDVNFLEVNDMGRFPAGKEVQHYTIIRNFDRDKGARIISIDGDNLLSECKPSLDSIEPTMIIGVDFKLKVPEEKGPFDATMRINYKNVKKPSIIKLHGYAE